MSPRATERGISATSRIIGNPRWAKYKIRGCTSRLLSMINGALNPISTASCPYVLCSFKNTTTGQKSRPGRGTARQGTHSNSSCQQHSPCAGSRFAVLSDGGIDAFPILSAPQEPNARKPRMNSPCSRMQCTSFRKLKKNENTPLLIATVNAGVKDSEFARKADEIRHKCWEERVRAKGETHHGRHQTLSHQRDAFDTAAWRCSEAAGLVSCCGFRSSRVGYSAHVDPGSSNSWSATGDPIPNLEQRLPLITRAASRGP